MENNGQSILRIITYMLGAMITALVGLYWGVAKHISNKLIHTSGAVSRDFCDERHRRIDSDLEEIKSDIKYLRSRIDELLDRLFGGD